MAMTGWLEAMGGTSGSFLPDGPRLNSNAFFKLHFLYLSNSSYCYVQRVAVKPNEPAGKAGLHVSLKILNAVCQRDDIQWIEEGNESRARWRLVTIRGHSRSRAIRAL